MTPSVLRDIRLHCELATPGDAILRTAYEVGPYLPGSFPPSGAFVSFVWHGSTADTRAVPVMQDGHVVGCAYETTFEAPR